MTTNPDPTPTPRTDAAEFDCAMCAVLRPTVHSSFARKLERELDTVYGKLCAANLLLEAEKQRRMAAELAHETDCGLLQAKLAAMEAERDRETEFCMGLAMVGPDAIKEKFQEAAALKKELEALKAERSAAPSGSAEDVAKAIADAIYSKYHLLPKFNPPNVCTVNVWPADFAPIIVPKLAPFFNRTDKTEE